MKKDGRTTNGGISKRVFQYSLSGEFIKSHESARDAAKLFKKGRHQQIQGNCSYIRANAYGYLWRYEDDEKKIGTEHSPTYNKKFTEQRMADNKGFRGL